MFQLRQERPLGARLHRGALTGFLAFASWMIRLVDGAFCCLFAAAGRLEEQVLQVPRGWAHRASLPAQQSGRIVGRCTQTVRLAACFALCAILQVSSIVLFCLAVCHRTSRSRSVSRCVSTSRRALHCSPNFMFASWALQLALSAPPKQEPGAPQQQEPRARRLVQPPRPVSCFVLLRVSSLFAPPHLQPCARANGRRGEDADAFHHTF